MVILAEPDHTGLEVDVAHDQPQDMANLRLSDRPPLTRLIGVRYYCHGGHGGDDRPHEWRAAVRGGRAGATSRNRELLDHAVCDVRLSVAVVTIEA